MSFSPIRETDPGAVAALPPAPPLEVLEAMGAAAQAYERLAASGRALRFSPDPETGRLSVQLVDRAGTVLRSVPVSTVLHVAAGVPLA